MLDWARQEGWNPGLDDAPPFWAADPQGYFVAEADGQPVASISVVNHDAGFAFLGLYICRPDHRGQGIAYGLWQHALAHAGDRTVGLDGVPAQQDNYRKSGFVPAGSTLRMQGRVRARADDAVRRAAPGDTAALLSLDRRANGYDRGAFLVPWTASVARRTTLVLDEAGTVSGFATVRLCHAGIKIGPVAAPDATAAMRLIRAAAGVFDADSAMIDVSAGNRPLLCLLEAEGLAASFPTARMYRGAAPRQDGTLQAAGTLELG
jgi:GNAT superfamily N-acetyltransferase